MGGEEHTHIDAVGDHGAVLRQLQAGGVIGGRSLGDGVQAALQLGIETTVDAKGVIAKCLEKGVVCLSAKNKVRLLPALNIPQEQLEKAIAILADVIEELAAQ